MHTNTLLFQVLELRDSEHCQQRGEEEGGDFFLQGRMIWGSSKLHTCLPKCLDQTRGTQMAEADKGVSYCVGFVFFFLSPRRCFEFVCEGRVRGEEDNCIV